MAQNVDYIVIGAGIAGASVAWELSRESRVVLIERESQLGYHSTGRSAAVYTEIYGNEVIRALTLASLSFFREPPAGFSDAALLKDRPMLMIGRPDQQESIDALYTSAVALVPTIRVVQGDELQRLLPMLRPGYAAAAVLDTNAGDLDVHAIHYGLWRGALGRGCQLLRDTDVSELRLVDGCWTVDTRQGQVQAPVVVNAAGAWADEVAARAGARRIGLVPKRRSAFIFPPPDGQSVDDWPSVIDVDEQFYFKPDAGRILGSPADETPSPPCDAQPEDIDIAIAIDRICKAADFDVRRIENRWAGLRSFVPDKTPVVGFDPDLPGFFWLAAQGGYGIQTSPAMAQVASALIRGDALPDGVAKFGVTADQLSPARLRQTD